MTFITTTRLKKLGETDDYGVADDSHDIRGWSVVDDNGIELGKVADLLFDSNTEQVRYVIVDTLGRHVLIPLGSLGFEHEPRRVVALGYALDRLSTLEPFTAEMMTEGLMTLEAERAYYLASVPAHKDDDPLDYGIPVYQGATPKPIKRPLTVNQL
jgi:sporulation protein YlmC with PRC-barrel domain